MKVLELPRPATIDDLYGVEGKAELVNGQIVIIDPSGFTSTRAAAAICRSLWDHEAAHGGGYALPGGGYAVDLPHRKSFCPDGAWYTGRDTGGRFMEGAPALAIEVRSEGDYGLTAEREMAVKRADYFAAGTQVVWDVDVLRAGVIRVFRADDPARPSLFRRGDLADAEPAVPGWRFAVDELFR
ncbi:Uma2 family endonuclease [Longimicrobium sp.]|jgi:Uma2 family endonuclease|uniref:Uma2 family endonuclease n=1 Tax=Longimicrobium sp. TaxID=2029185 RepID=UPI002F95F2C1